MDHTPLEAFLAYFPKMTPKRFTDSVAILGSVEAVWQAQRKTLITELSWKEDLADAFCMWREELDTKKIEKILAQEGITVITKTDSSYPPLLQTIYDPPFCLFVRGTLDLSDAYPLAVVGTRKCTPYGRQVTEELVSGLVHHGMTIVSGLALGIDAIAHETTLRGHGRTIAVLGSGINDRHVYPAVHRGLANKIVADGGAVISEFPPGTLPSKFTFPRRNRIISGLSLGTLVVEATEKSGALITSSCALEHGREVFAVPHPITTETGTGPNKLIKEGAHMVTSTEDIIDALHLKELELFSQNTKVIPDTPIEASILEHLSREPLHIDELVKQSGLTSKDASSTLTLMEMKGKIRNIGNMHYVLGR